MSVGRKPYQTEVDEKTAVEEWVINQLESEPKRWSELWETGTEYNIFSSTRYLQSVLELLLKKKLIKKTKYSHKDVRYSLDDNFAKLRESLGIDNTGFTYHRETIQQLEKIRKSNLVPFLKFNINMKMLKLLSELNWLSKNPKKYQEISDQMILIIMNQLRDLLVRARKKSPELTDLTINEMQYHFRKEINQFELLTNAPTSLNAIRQEMLSNLDS